MLHTLPTSDKVTMYLTSPGSISRESKTLASIPLSRDSGTVNVPHNASDFHGCIIQP